MREAGGRIQEQKMHERRWAVGVLIKRSEMKCETFHFIRKERGLVSSADSSWGNEQEDGEGVFECGGEKMSQGNVGIGRGALEAPTLR